MPPWDRMKSFRLSIYPDEITVITDLPQEQYPEAVRRWEDSCEMGSCRNIEDIVRGMGYFACAGVHSPIHIKR